MRPGWRKAASGADIGSAAGTDPSQESKAMVAACWRLGGDRLGMRGYVLGMDGKQHVRKRGAKVSPVDVLVARLLLRARVARD